MNKLFFILALAVLSIPAFSQIYMTTAGKMEFFSETPLENIHAVNNSVSSLINTSTDSILVRLKNTGFTFKNALMQDHFNENYMESTKYPLDSFRGKINETIDYKKDGTYNVTATGKLSLHGVTNPTTIKGTLKIAGGILQLAAGLMVHTADYKIEIPKLVWEKIAEDIKVSFNAEYNLKK